jgi:hypothetical protein
MCRENLRHGHQGHHHHQSETDHTHHHDELHAEGSSLSRSERLIIRLQHTIRHNHDHAATYLSMAKEGSPGDRCGGGGSLDSQRSGAKCTTNRRLGESAGGVEIR